MPVITKLDEHGQPVGEPWQVEATIKFQEALQPLVAEFVRISQYWSTAFNLPRDERLERILFGASLHNRRYWRHRNSIKIVPKRRNKHGRVGVRRGA